MSDVKVKSPTILRADGYHVIGDKAYVTWGDPPPLPALEVSREVPDQ